MITIDQQWCVTKAEEAFYGKANQSGAVRKLQQTQAGTTGVQNDTCQYNNLYGQGGYQNRSQTSGSVMVLCQNTGQKDSNAMEVDWTQKQRPSVKYYKCQKLGHIMKDCRAPFNIRNMIYKKLQDHFDQTKVAKKDREVICTKEKVQQDFSAATQ